MEAECLRLSVERSVTGRDKRFSNVLDSVLASVQVANHPEALARGSLAGTRGHNRLLWLFTHLGDAPRFWSPGFFHFYGGCADENVRLITK